MLILTFEEKPNNLINLMKNLGYSGLGVMEI
jgi:hypothetical protein